MGRTGAWTRWRAILLALALLLPGTPELLLADHAAALANAAAVRAAGPAAGTATAPLRLPPAQPPTTLTRPSPSLAPPLALLNPPLDGAHEPVGAQPTNRDLAQAGFQVGSPPGNNAGTLTNTPGAPRELITGSFTVAAEAQSVSLFIKGLTTGSDQFYLDVLPAGGTATRINGLDYQAPDAGETKRFNIAAWRGQTIQLKVYRQYGRLEIADLGRQWVDFPGWDLEGRGRPVAGATDGAARLDNIQGTSALVTAPFALDPTAQQVAFTVAAEGSPSTVKLELLSGPGFATTTLLRQVTVPAGGAWAPARAVLAPWAGQTVRRRVKSESGVLLVDAVQAELALPGWTPEGPASPIAVGADGDGSWVSPHPEGSGAFTIRSSRITTAIANVAGRVDSRRFPIAYAIGQQTGSLLRVKWFSDAYPNGYDLGGDGSNTPTGRRVKWFTITDQMGMTGYLTVNATGGGRVYDVGLNLLGVIHGDECTVKVGNIKVGDPIDTTTGVFGQTVTEFSVGSGTLPLSFARTYVAGRDAAGTLGWGWRHGYDLRVEPVGTDARVVWPSGDEEWFAVSPGGIGTPTDGRIRNSLTRNADGSWRLRTTENLTYHFTANGLLSHVEDLRQNRLTVLRDAQGRVTSVTDPGGRQLTLAYDGQGRLSTVTGPGSGAGTATVTYLYDARNDLVGVLDQVGGRWEFAYDAFHRLVSVKDPDHLTSNPPVFVFKNTYDRTGRVVRQEDGSGRATEIAYETLEGQGGNPGVTQATGPDGRRTHYYYDAMAVTTHAWDASNRGTKYDFDAAHNVVAVTDNANQSWRFAYDVRGNPTEVKDPTQVADPTRGKTTVTWDSLDRPLTVTDARGTVTTLTYDAAGNRTRDEVRAAGGTLVRVVARTFDAEGQVLTETVDPGGLNLTTTYTYDPVANTRLTMTDPRGKVWRWEYDLAGRPTASIDPLGNRTETAYSAMGRVTATQDAAGGRIEWFYDGAGNRVRQEVLVAPGVERVTTWAYDGRRRVVSSTDPAGTVTSTEYDAAGRVARTTVDPGTGKLNLVTEFGYDEAGRPTTTTVDPGGLNLVSTTAYDTAGRVLRETDPNGIATESRYDAAGRLSATIVDAGTGRLNQTTAYGYDNAGNRTTTTNALSRVATTAYDALGRVASVTDPANQTISYAYDAAGRRTTVTDALNRVTTTAYDTAGRVSSVTAPGSRTTTYAYDDAGRRTGTTDPLNRTTTTAYDPAGRVVGTTDPLGRSATTTYNLAGQPTQRTSAGGVVTAYAYDAAGRLATTTIDPGTGRLNLTTTHAYDAAGRLTSTTDARNNPTTFGYDKAGRQTRITDALNGVVALAYDPGGRLTGVTNARGKTTTFGYDALGNVTRTTDPLNRSRTATYDVLGRLQSETDARGVLVDHAYDLLDRLTSTTYPAVGGQPAGSVTYAYDALGRRTGMTDATGTTTWAYTPAGDVTSVASPQGTVAYAWDAAGQRTGMTLPSNRSVTYAYDAAGMLSTLTDWQNRTTTFAHDPDGQRTGTTRPNGVGTTQTYDAAGRLGLVEHIGPGGALLGRFVYALDPNGNRTQVTASGQSVAAPGTETYGYDVLNRLTRAVYTDGTEQLLGYDPNGNRTSLTTTPPGGPTTVAGYAYDDADQLTSDGSLVYAHDASGNLTQAGTSTFAWDWRGRIAGATVGGTTTTYAWDGDGVRTGKFSGGTTSYLWDRLSELPLLVDDGTQGYVHAGKLLAGIAPGGAATWALTDGLGSVRGRADGAGALVGSASYDAFGTARATSGSQGTFGWAGEQADPETGQVHLRARQYAPGLGRFLAVDPVFPATDGTQGYQPYAYAGNNPTTWSDATGQRVTHVSGQKGQKGPSAPGIDAFGEVMGEPSYDAIPLQWEIARFYADVAPLWEAAGFKGVRLFLRGSRATGVTEDGLPARHGGWNPETEEWEFASDFDIAIAQDLKFGGVEGKTRYLWDEIVNLGAKLEGPSPDSPNRSQKAFPGNSSYFVTQAPAGLGVGQLPMEWRYEDEWYGDVSTRSFPYPNPVTGDIETYYPKITYKIWKDPTDILEYDGVLFNIAP